MLLGLLVELAYGKAGSGAHRASLGVDLDALHGREVYDQTAVGAGRARDVVTAGAHGQEQVVLAGEVHGFDDVFDAGAANDEGGAFFDHAVPELA